MTERYKCKGIIDRLMLAPDGAFEVHDYKTGSKLPDQAELDKDRQLALYQIGVQKLWPDVEGSPAHMACGGFRRRDEVGADA